MWDIVWCYVVWAKCVQWYQRRMKVVCSIWVLSVEYWVSDRSLSWLGFPSDAMFLLPWTCTHWCWADVLPCRRNGWRRSAIAMPHDSWKPDSPSPRNECNGLHLGVKHWVARTFSIFTSCWHQLSQIYLADVHRASDKRLDVLTVAKKRSSRDLEDEQIC